MSNIQIPGELTVIPPGAAESDRLRQLNPYVRQSGDEWRHEWRLPARKTFDYLLVYFPEGSGRATVGSEHFDINAGDLIWIPPNTYHEMEGDVYCQYFHCDLIYDPERSHWDAFVPEGLIDLSPWKARIHPPLDDDEINRWQGRLLCNTPPLISELFGTICREHLRYRNEVMLETSALVELLIHRILSEKDVHRSERSYHARRMQQAARMIRTSTTTTLNIAELAKSIGFSASHFRKLFREHYGFGPRHMHQQVRCEKACERLLYSSLNISEIAEELGFNSIHNFSRTFRKWMNLSPSEYRSQH